MNEFKISKEEEKELFNKYINSDKDIKIRNEIVTNNLGLINYVLNTNFKRALDGNENSNISREQLFQSGVMGLIEAVDKYDIMCDNRFATYAVYYIMKHVNTEICSNSSYSVNNKWYMKEYNRIITLRNRNLNDDEIMETMKITKKRFDNIIIAGMCNASTMSFDKRASNNDEDSTTLADVIADKSNDYDNIIKRELSSKINSILNDNRIYTSERGVEIGKKIMKAYYFEGKTYDVIASEFGSSRQNIHIKAKKILDNIRKYYLSDLKDFNIN